jgi:hypothetical protein
MLAPTLVVVGFALLAGFVIAGRMTGRHGFATRRYVQAG